MGLTSGTKLGPYEIQSPLGAGGMGEVYRARDTRLDRTVAIKVLPSHLSSSLEFRARFEREAKAISGLQHPNICVLYDVGSQDDVDFLVMEYLEGETLSSRLARKPLTPDESLKIAIEIAEALEKAHRSGIIHRDLKPGNVMLTKAGAKLMDFGLAKPSALPGDPKSGTPSISSMATMAATMADLASPVTVQGTLVGTMQYMSPEQIQGKEADARSDVFAFGAMLYEMLTGKRAFVGKSQLSVASAILERDPDPITTLRPLTPPAIEQVVRTCLAKDPDDRFQSAHDLKLQLQWIAAGTSHAGAPAVVTSAQRKFAPIVATIMVAGWILAMVAGFLAFRYAQRLSSAQQAIRASIQDPPGFDLAAVLGGAPAVSPDGLLLAFVALPKGKSDLGGADYGGIILVRHLSTGAVMPLSGSDGGSFPFWSPDGNYIGFFAQGKLKKVDVAGGAAQVLCDAPEGRGGSWSQAGTIIFAPRISGPLMAVSDGGGTPAPLPAARKEAVDFTNRNPTFLPDGRHFLFIARAGNEALGSVYAGSLDGSEPRLLLTAASNVAYSDGYLFFEKEGTLMAQRFDAAGLRLEDKPISIAANIEYYNPRDLGYFSVGGNVLVYRTSTVQNRDLAWLDLSGKELEHWGEPAAYDGGSFSSGSQICILTRQNASGRGNSLWLADLQRKTVTRLTSDSDLEQTGVAAADGNSVFIATTSGHLSTLVRRWLTASGKEEKLLEEPRGFFEVISISRDGRYVFFSEQDAKTSFDIYYMDLLGDRKVTPLLNTPYAEQFALLSSDDKWLAYTSNDTGRAELYVTPFPGTGSKWQISNGGIVGHEQSFVVDWSADSRNLRFQQADKLYNVEVRVNGNKPEFSVPKEISTLTGDPVVLAILPDGKRLLVARRVGDRTFVPVDLVVNWQRLVR